jgi:hypothetical protein
MLLGEGVVDPATATALADHLAPEPGDKHPFVEPFASVTERFLLALPFAGAEAVERYREVVNAE